MRKILLFFVVFSTLASLDSDAQRLRRDIRWSDYNWEYDVGWGTLMFGPKDENNTSNGPFAPDLQKGDSLYIPLKKPVLFVVQAKDEYFDGGFSALYYSAKSNTKSIHDQRDEEEKEFRKTGKIKLNL